MLKYVNAAFDTYAMRHTNGYVLNYAPAQMLENSTRHIYMQYINTHHLPPPEYAPLSTKHPTHPQTSSA
jgi:hypothetical protein